MAKHELVCVKAYTVPEQNLGPMRISGLGGVDLGTVGEPIVVPARHYPVGARGAYTRKADALKAIKSGNWAYAN